MWEVLDICHSVKPSGATQKMVRRTPTPVRSLRSRKIRWTRKPARSLGDVACCREVFSSLATPHDQMIKLLSPSRRFFFDSFTLSNFFFFLLLLRDSSTFSKLVRIRSSSNIRVVGRKNLCIFIHCEKANVHANLCLCA